MRKLVSLLILFFGLCGICNAQDRRVPIICYHHISDGKKANSNFYLEPKLFKSHLDFLQKEGYETVTFEDVYHRGLKLGPKPIILTFDDGARDHWQVFQELKSRGMKGVFFIITGAMNLKPYQIELMDKGGMEIGSHTVHHPYLTRLSRADFWQEVNESKHTLEVMLGHKIITLAYPYGAYNDNVLNMMSVSSYIYGRTTDEYIMAWGEKRNYRLPVVLIRKNHKDLSRLIK